MKGDLVSGCTASASIVFMKAPVITVSEMFGGYVSWNAVEGATGYRIYRRIWKDGTPSAWEKVKVNEGPDPFTFYVETTGESGYYHEYKVYAVNGNSISVGSNAEKVSYLARPEAPTVWRSYLDTVLVGINVRIAPVNGATSYSLYRLVGGRSTLIYTGSAGDFLDKDATAQGTYWYYVIAHSGNRDTEPSDRRSITI